MFFESLYEKMKQYLIFPFFDNIARLNLLVQLNFHIAKVIKTN
jgi:hypothetical protein